MTSRSQTATEDSREIQGDKEEKEYAKLRKNKEAQLGDNRKHRERRWVTGRKSEEYEHVKLLKRSKYREFRLNDEEGHIIQETEETIRLTERRYEEISNTNEENRTKVSVRRERYNN